MYQGKKIPSSLINKTDLKKNKTKNKKKRSISKIKNNFIREII